MNNVENLSAANEKLEADLLMPASNSPALARDIYDQIQSKKGQFYKFGKRIRIMVKRYFVLRGDCLLYYLKQNSKKIKGIINLYLASFKQVPQVKPKG